MLKWAKRIFFNQDRKISEKTETARDILELETELLKMPRGFRIIEEEFDSLLISHPSLFTRVVLREEVANFEQYGFPSKRSLEETVTSFCIGEKDTLRRWTDTNYIWRQGKWKNIISLNMHGDLYAGQADISGIEKIERTLFGDETIFDTFKPIDWKGISSHQDWSQYLIATVRYAQAIGKEKIPEIINWQQVLAEGGQVGTHTAEAMCGSGGMDFIPFLMQQEILTDQNIEEFPIRIRASNEFNFFPYIKNQQLIYLAEDGVGEISLNYKPLKDKKYSPRIEYTEEDLPHILKATYKFFARDKRLLPKIMDAFLSEIQ